MKVGDRLYTCSDCPAIFTSRKAAERHVRLSGDTVVVEEMVPNPRGMLPTRLELIGRIYPAAELYTESAEVVFEKVTK